MQFNFFVTARCLTALLLPDFVRPIRKYDLALRGCAWFRTVFGVFGSDHSQMDDLIGPGTRCTRSIRCSDPATATRSALRWPGSAFPTSWSRSTSCKAKAARRNSSARIRTATCRCWKSRLAAISPNRTPSSGTSPAARCSRRKTASRRAEALQWMFFEQHSLEPNIGAAYFWLALIKGGRDLQSHALEDWMENGYRALGVMETHLARYRLFRRQPLHHRRHRALRLYPRRRPMRLRPRPLSGHSRLARPRRATSPAMSPMDWQPELAPRPVALGIPSAFYWPLPRKRPPS